MTTREQKVAAIKREFTELTNQRAECLANIKTKWATASVQDMRLWEETILRAEGRLTAIKRLKSWVEVK